MGDDAGGRRGFRRLFRAANAGLLVDVAVCIGHLLMVDPLLDLFLDTAGHASHGDLAAQAALVVAATLLFAMPPAAALLKRDAWHARRAPGAGSAFDDGLSGCLFNPIFYFVLQLLLAIGVTVAVSQWIWGERDSAAIMLGGMALSLTAAIVHTWLVYRYFSPPKVPPVDSPGVRARDWIGNGLLWATALGFQALWALGARMDLTRVAGVGDFIGRVFLFLFLALLLYFPPRMLLLVDDIHRPRLWLGLLIANSPILYRMLVGTV